MAARLWGFESPPEHHTLLQDNRRDRRGLVVSTYSPMDLIIATRNPGKTAEFKDLFSGLDLQCQDISALPDAPVIAEDTDSFAGNAVKKAMLTALFARRWVLADDSGLEVAALGNAPGVRSARYAGDEADDSANNRKLLSNLRGIKNRSARFCCVLALASPSGHAQIVEGDCRGTIAESACGEGGFGYDPLFIPHGYSQTLAELGPAVKNRISHRAAAMRRALDLWRDILAGDLAEWPDRRARAAVNCG